MTMQFGKLPEGALIEGAISEDAVLALRRLIWSDGMVDANEVDEILAINEQITRPSKAWITFFVEAVSEFLINTSLPRGYLSDMQADWLILRMERDGRIDSPAKLELLVHLLERVDAAPVRLKGYILDQVERAVVSGAGPTRDPADTDTAGCITDEECALIRRLIFAPSGFAPAHVSVEEAEMLFRIKDATLNGDNAPAWKSLFVQGVANYLSGWRVMAMPTAEQEAAHQQFLAGRKPVLTSYLDWMVRKKSDDIVAPVRPGGFGRRQTGHDFFAEPRTDYRAPDQADTLNNQTWLDAHVDADGQIDALETALIAFLKDETLTRG